MSWCTFFFLCHFLQLFSCARIVSTNSVLPGKSRLFPLRLYRVIKLLFLVCISMHFGTFPLMRVSCKEILFCSNFLEFFSCALSCSKTPFLCALLRILWIFPSAAFYPEKFGKTAAMRLLYYRVHKLPNIPGKCHYLQLSTLRIYRVHKLPHAPIASTFFNNPFSQISGKNRDKSMNNGDKSEKNRYKKLYSPITF